MNACFESIGVLCQEGPESWHPPYSFYLRCSLKMFKPARTATMSAELLMRDIFKMISCILNHELTTCFSPEKEGAQCPSLVEEGPCLAASFMGQVGPTNQPIGLEAFSERIILISNRWCLAKDSHDLIYVIYLSFFGCLRWVFSSVSPSFYRCRGCQGSKDLWGQRSTLCTTLAFTIGISSLFANFSSWPGAQVLLTSGQVGPPSMDEWHYEEPGICINWESSCYAVEFMESIWISCGCIYAHILPPPKKNMWNVLVHWFIACV